MCIYFVRYNDCQFIKSSITQMFNFVNDLVISLFLKDLNENELMKI